MGPFGPRLFEIHRGEFMPYLSCSDLIVIETIEEYSFKTGTQRSPKKLAVHANVTVKAHSRSGLTVRLRIPTTQR